MYKISFQKKTKYNLIVLFLICAYVTEDESTDNLGYCFDKGIIQKLWGGFLFLKVIHESSKDNEGIGDIGIGVERIGLLKEARHGKSIIYILPY
jgi:hypothetical protein